MIKELEVEELNTAAKIGQKFWGEGALPGRLVPEVFVRNWTTLMNNGMGKIFGLYDGPDLVGALGAIVVPDLNDGDLTATECFWFVEEDHRGNGVRLLLNFVKYAKEIGCVRVNMVHLFNEHADKLQKLYGKLGFSPVETHYIKTF